MKYLKRILTVLLFIFIIAFLYWEYIYIPHKEMATAIHFKGRVETCTEMYRFLNSNPNSAERIEILKSIQSKSNTTSIAAERAKRSFKSERARSVISSVITTSNDLQELASTRQTYESLLDISNHPEKRTVVLSQNIVVARTSLNELEKRIYDTHIPLMNSTFQNN